MHQDHAQVKVPLEGIVVCTLLTGHSMMAIGCISQVATLHEYHGTAFNKLSVSFTFCGSHKLQNYLFTVMITRDVYMYCIMVDRIS